MQTYGEFQPTGFDPAGLGLPDQQDWLVLGVGRNRDSGCLAESNFHTALKELGGESETVEVHRFGHWGPGWFEIILLHPSRKEDGESIESSLEDYCVLDDMDLSEREHEWVWESWTNGESSDFRRELVRQHGLSDATEEFLDDLSHEALYEYYRQCIPSGEESSEDHSMVPYAVKHSTRESLARFIREQRRAA